MNRLKLIFALLGIGHFWIATAQNVQAISVCDALKRLLEIDNQAMAIRGEYILEREATDVGGGDECGGAVVLEDARWPAVIALRITQLTSSSPLKKLSDLSATCQRPRCNLKATFVGKLRSYHARQSYLDRLGIRRWVGFGHLGHAPAEMEVTAIQDIVLER